MQSEAVDVGDVALHLPTSEELNMTTTVDETHAVTCGDALHEAKVVAAAGAVTAAADERFWHELASICWCPTRMEPPDARLPWPDNVRGRLAPPKLVRPVSAAWLVSSCLRLLDAPEPPPALSRRLGWTLRLPPAVLAGQLCELGKTFHRVPPEDDALVAQLDCTVLKVYAPQFAHPFGFALVTSRVRVRLALGERSSHAVLS